MAIPVTQLANNASVLVNNAQGAMTINALPVKAGSISTMDNASTHVRNILMETLMIKLVNNVSKPVKTAPGPPATNANYALLAYTFNLLAVRPIAMWDSLFYQAVRPARHVMRLVRNAMEVLTHNASPAMPATSYQ